MNYDLNRKGVRESLDVLMCGGIPVDNVWGHIPSLWSFFARIEHLSFERGERFLPFSRLPNETDNNIHSSLMIFIARPSYHPRTPCL